MVETGLTEDELALILVLYTASRRAKHDRLYVAWRAHLHLSVGADSDRRFRRAARRLSSTMVRIVDGPSGHYYEFHNPSIQDFLHGHLGAYREILGSLFDTAVYPDQLTTLWLTATGLPRREDLHTSARQVSDKVRNAVIRIGTPSQTLTVPIHQVRRSWIKLVLELGEIAYNHELGRIGADLLDDLDPLTYGTSGLVDLADLLGRSAVPEWHSRAEKAAEAACEAALSDVDDWDSATDTSDTFENLEGLFPVIVNDAQLLLRERKLEIAGDIMDQWEEDSRSIDVDSSELEEIIEFIEEEGGPMTAGYERAATYLRNRPSQPIRPPVERRAARPVEDDQVDQMFAKWRQGN